MEPFVAALAIVIAGLVAATAAHQQRQQRVRRANVWRLSAEACGLTNISVSRSILRGVLREPRHGDDLSVEITDYGQGNKGDSGTRIVLHMAASRATAVQLRAEGVGTSIDKVLGAREIEVGDRTFDAEFFIQGSAVQSLAFLDAENRRLLLDLRARVTRLQITYGRLQVDVREGFNTDLAASLPPALYTMLEIGRRWPRHTEAAARVAHNALRDPQIGVRLHNLLLLTRELEGEPIVQETLQAACKDPWPEIRLRAAAALGSKGHAVLFALAEGVEDDVAARAIGALGRWMTPERAAAVLDEALRADREATAVACIGLLGRTGGETALRRITKILRDEGRWLRVAAAQALGWSGLTAAEEPLLTALHDAAPEVRLAAATALGEVGTAAAVLPLKEVAEHESALRRTVRQSVASIQARATRAAPGQISLAGDSAGQVSLSEGDAGRVSLPAEPIGRVDLPESEK